VLRLSSSYVRNCCAALVLTVIASVTAVGPATAATAGPESAGRVPIIRLAPSSTGTPPLTQNPSANIAPVPAYTNGCQANPMTSTCQTAGIAALNHGRAAMGQPAYVLPANFTTLSALDQFLVLSNADRTLYGLNAIAGFNTALNAAAQVGVNQDTDPIGPTSVDGHSYRGWASNWAAGWSSPLYTYYEWMYDDGPHGTNIDCTPTDLSGCWGHRDNTLVDFGTNVVVMGAATGTSTQYGGTAFTELYEAFAPGSAITLTAGGSATTSTATTTSTIADEPSVTTASPTVPIAAGSGATGIKVAGGFEIATRGPTGTLWLNGPMGAGDTHLGLAIGTTPSLVAVPGGVQIAFQAGTGLLWTIGADGNQNLGVPVAPGSSPGIIAVPGGYEIAYQAPDGALHLVGALGTVNTGLGLAPATSPSLIATPGGFEVAFQANSGALWMVGTLGNTNTGLGLAPATSPSLTAVPGGFEAAFQANSGALWLVGTLGNVNTGLGVAHASSPAITAIPGGWAAAFASSGGTLWQLGSQGNRNTGLGVATGASPSITAAGTGSETTWPASDGQLWWYGSAGTGRVLSRR
jgi:hypothetical protein